MKKSDMINAFNKLHGSNCSDPIDRICTSDEVLLKYNVTIISWHRSVIIKNRNSVFGIKVIRVSYCRDSDLPYAIIECILKANNLWVIE